ncbi:hypothetical protein SG26_08065 [Haloarcula sp. CBA1115]|uniref:type IV pilin n=1 Tax=Haloarcula TaxID=2237 RepID=UPI0005955B85|nr:MULTISPECIES: type IV pilin N-terminal domain-containing protein [unclassified Haloarcula]AJF25686.1 hypothetical protein SG26_08065 [Haloarcula sp. CBA1115]
MDLTNLKELLTDDDAVSPVIGVILMVAITVILAAVIASFVLGLGDQASQQTPTASFSFDYEADSATSGDLTITHDGGDAVQGNELYLRGSGLDTSGEWASDISGNASADGGSAVAAGDVAEVGADSDFSARIVYQSLEGDNSATLAEDSGPDA